MRSMREYTDKVIKRAIPKYTEFRSRNPRAAFAIVWVGVLFVSAAFTVVANGVSFFLTSSYKWGIAVSVFWWALVFGWCVLAFLPSKAVATVIGALLGITVSDLGTGGAALIAKLNEQVTAIAAEIGNIADPAGGTDPFIRLMVWMFVVVFGVVCVPAFFVENPAAGGKPPDPLQ